MIIDQICSPLTNQNVKLAIKRYDHLKKLNLAETGEGMGQVDLLIGSGYYSDIFSARVCRGEKGPVALESIFGWVLSGPIEVGSETSQCTAMLNSAHAICSLIRKRNLKLKHFGTWKH